HEFYTLLLSHFFNQENIELFAKSCAPIQQILEGLSVEAELKSQVLEQLTYRSFQLFDSQEEIEKVFYLAIKVRESYYLSTKNNKRKMALESIWLKELLAKENPNALLYV